MKSLTKIMILSLSLGIFAQDTYASAKPEKEDTGCSCWTFMKSFRKARKVLEPMAESALDIAAKATGDSKLHDAATIMHTVNGGIDSTEVALKIDLDAATLQKGVSNLDLKGGVQAVTHDVSDVLKAVGQDGSTVAGLVKKAEDLEKKL